MLVYVITRAVCWMYGWPWPVECCIRTLVSCWSFTEMVVEALSALAWALDWAARRKCDKKISLTPHTGM